MTMPPLSCRQPLSSYPFGVWPVGPELRSAQILAFEQSNINPMR